MGACWLSWFANGGTGRGSPFCRRADLGQNTIVNPVLVPPLLGIYLHPGDHHAEVNVLAECHPSRTADADLLLLADRVAHLDSDLAQVAIEALKRVTVVKDDAVTVKPKPVGIDNPAGIRRGHRRA